MTPTRMIAAISSEVPTGRSMKIRDGFMSRSCLLVGLRRPDGLAAVVGLATARLRRLLALAVCRAGAGRWRCGHGRAGGHPRTPARPANLGAVAQAVGAIDDDLVADLQPAHDLLLLAVGRPELNDADLDRVIGLHAIDEGSGLAALD